MKDESGEQFVAYFLPTDETMVKRNRDKEDGKRVPRVFPDALSEPLLSQHDREFVPSTWFKE